MKLWVTNPKLSCKDDIEAAYYSRLVDKGDHPLVCYHCGNELNAECHQKYIESKDIHKTVKPTCTLIIARRDQQRSGLKDRNEKKIRRVQKKLVETEVDSDKAKRGGGAKCSK